MSRRIACQCEAPVHFEQDVSKLPEGNGGSNHVAGSQCSYVVRAQVGSALICAACDRAGHGFVRHPDAFARFHAQEPQLEPEPEADEPEPDEGEGNLWDRIVASRLEEQKGEEA